MAHKTRYWVCRQCCAVYNRRKTEDYRDCPKCGSSMVAARKYPYDVWNKRERQRLKEKKELTQSQKKHAVPRTCFGYRLNLSTKTRKAWKLLLTAQQRRSFISRGDNFLNKLREDIWSCPHGRGYRENRECKCTGGGMVEAPKVVVVDRDPGALGRYERGVLQGRYQIVISWDGDHKFETLIHEALHYIDDMAKIPSKLGSHDKTFYQREADLQKQLRYSE